MGNCADNRNINFMFKNIFFRKSCLLRDNVEKCGTAGQATDDNIMRQMRFACSITKTRPQTHTESI
jgi:hypothetical protein